MWASVQCKNMHLILGSLTVTYSIYKFNKFSFKIKHFTINQICRGPCLLPVLLAVHTSSVSYHSYQKGERTEPGNLLSKCCTFSSLFAPLSLLGYFTTFVSSISFFTVLSVVSIRHRFKSLYLTWFVITKW